MGSPCLKPFPRALETDFRRTSLIIAGAFIRRVRIDGGPLWARAIT
jgi:hypothetical protein